MENPINEFNMLLHALLVPSVNYSLRLLVCRNKIAHSLSSFRQFWINSVIVAQCLFLMETLKQPEFALTGLCFIATVAEAHGYNLLKPYQSDGKKHDF